MTHTTLGLVWCTLVLHRKACIYIDQEVVCGFYESNVDVHSTATVYCTINPSADVNKT